MVLRSWRPFLLLLLLLLAGKLTKPQVSSWQSHQGEESSSKWLDRNISSQGR